MYSKISNMHVGDKILCVDDSIKNPKTKDLFKNWIKKDLEYTIRGTSLSLEGELGLLLEEVRNPPVEFTVLGGFAEPRFNANRFRKAEVLTTSINEEMENLV